MHVETQLLPFISVVVPIRNEEPFIRRTVDQLLAQKYDPDRFEVIVVDGHSTDATRNIVGGLCKEHPNLELLHNPRRLASSARNIGVRHARGDIVVFVDGHCDLGNEHYLRDLADAFGRSGAACVARPQPLDVRGANRLQRAIAIARDCWLGHHPSSWIYSDTEQFIPPQSAAVAYRKSIFDKVGYFDESFDACEDVEFNQRVDRLGLKCFFTPKVKVSYYPRDSFSGLFRQLFRYGRGRSRLLRKHPSTFSPACFVPTFFFMGLITGPFLAMLSPWLAAIYFGTIAIYVAMVIAVSLGLAARRNAWSLMPIIPLVFAAIHLGSGAGTLLELLRGSFATAGHADAMGSERIPAHATLRVTHGEKA